MHMCPSSFLSDEPVELSEGLQILVDEHPPLRDQLEKLNSLCTNVEKGAEADSSFNILIQEVNDFSAKLEAHSLREEDYLFPMMEVYLGKSGGPIAVMEYEHERAKKLINEFLNNVDSESQEAHDVKIKNSNLIKNAYTTLIDHFAKEEQVLYPMAERMFSEEEKESLKQKVLDIK